MVFKIEVKYVARCYERAETVLQHFGLETGEHGLDLGIVVEMAAEL